MRLLIGEEHETDGRDSMKALFWTLIGLAVTSAIGVITCAFVGIWSSDQVLQHHLLNTGCVLVAIAFVAGSIAAFVHIEL